MVEFRPGRKRLRHLFRALESRNFRLFVSGQLVSLVGTWMQQMAMSWLVYKLTGSAWMLGLVAFLGQGPGFLVAPFAGTLADRFNRHRMLIATQTLAMAQALALAYLAFTGTVQVWQVVYLSVFLGFVNGVDIPVRQAFVLDMLKRPEDLSNAISLNSSVFNASRLIGPSIAGLVIATLGEDWCFLLNGVSYLGVLLALLSMRLDPRPRPVHRAGYLQSLREGFAYAYGFKPMRTILQLVILISLTGLPYSVLMPVYAKDILHGGPQTLGFLMGAAGAGALSGAVYLASRPSVLGLGRLIPMASTLFGLSLIGLAASGVLGISILLMYLLGVGMMLQLASCNIILQTLADDDKRGRVMSLYTMSFLGMTPFGSLLVGSLASEIGVPFTLVLGGTACMGGALFFASRLPHLRKLARPVYMQKGIIPQETVTAPARS